MTLVYPLEKSPTHSRVITGRKLQLATGDAVERYPGGEVFIVAGESVFLTVREAVEAVCEDFKQYSPQILLFSQVIQELSQGRTIVKREGRKNGAWVSVGGRPNMRWMEGEEMAEYLCDLLLNTDLDHAILSSICAMVFHTRASLAVHPDTGHPAIRIETGMEDFACRQCGQCCLSLDYHGELTAHDVALWKDLGRDDILKWVHISKRKDGGTEYRIWTIPGTTRVADVCPFLNKVSTENRWECLIQEIKPGICRQYPASRKHAFMTGCRGFESGFGKNSRY